VRQSVHQLDLSPLASYAMHAYLIPSSYLERVASTRTLAQGEPLRELAERRRMPLFATGEGLELRRPRSRRCSSAPTLE